MPSMNRRGWAREREEEEKQMGKWNHWVAMSRAPEGMRVSSLCYRDSYCPIKLEHHFCISFQFMFVMPSWQYLTETIVSTFPLWWVKLPAKHGALPPCYFSILTSNRTIVAVIWGWDGVKQIIIWMQFSLRSYRCVWRLKIWPGTSSHHHWVHAGPIVRALKLYYPHDYLSIQLKR